MNPPDHHSEAVWERTLPHIRSTRRKRRYRRIAGVAAACCGFALWLTLRGPENTAEPVVSIEPAAPGVETIVVMRIDDHGAIRLEEVASNELGQIELALGQAPLLSDDSPY